MYLYVVPLFVPIALWGGRVLAESWPPRSRAWRRAGAAALAVWVLALVGFNLMPESVLRGKSRRALSRELAARLPAPREQVRLYALSDPSHSISFYTGLLSRRVDDVDTDEVVRFLREERRQGRIGLMEMRSKKTGKLEPGACRVLADDGETAVVTLAEPAPPARP
jgi:hypothetical protein